MKTETKETREKRTSYQKEGRRQAKKAQKEEVFESRERLIVYKRGESLLAKRLKVHLSFLQCSPTQ